ncbi:MAG: diaminopimelate dehydrogenase [Firmicutes bacterium]|nr:diaminopimelate dehydrogenase [Bacillota bacterium]
MKKELIKIGICGYGNLGRGVELNIAQNPDMELAAVFTRRKPPGALKIQSDVPVVHVDDAADWRDKIDVMILCGGSAQDLPQQGPAFAKMFNTVDSFDTHAKIPDYLSAMDAAAKAGSHASVVSVGWDPGLFSLMRLFFGSVLPNGKTYSFWGEGVSQGHSDAIRKVNGVADAIQYTVPKAGALERIRKCTDPNSTPLELIPPNFTAREMHSRHCWVATKDGADEAQIERDIKQMADYFADYDTTVNFISQEKLREFHSKLYHGGKVIRVGKTKEMSDEVNRHALVFSLKLDSNPEFTSSVLLAYVRAVYRLAGRGEYGAKTVFDIPPVLLFPTGAEDAVKKLL